MYSISSFDKTVLILILLLLPAGAFSQETTTCAENLKNAQNLFDRGQVDQVPAMLHDCMKSGFTREEELSAYKLLIQSFLFEDKLDMADSTMLEFLKKNPEYQLSPTDHSSFVYLFNKFSVKPLIQLTVHLGTSLPFVTFVDQKTTSGMPVIGNYSSKALNFYGSLEARYKISKKLEISLEAGFSQVKFTNTEDLLNLKDTVFARTTYVETQSRIEVPLTVTYNFKSFGKFTPYTRLGFGPAIIIGSNATAEQKSTAILGGGSPHAGREVSRTKSRINTDIFVQAGAGLKLKTRGGFISAELRLNPGFYNQVIRGGDAEIEHELATSYSYADDNFNLNTLNFSFGYTQIFYKASKKKE